MSANVDFQEVYRCVSGDLVLFVTAMIGWAVLHHVKKASQTKALSKKECLVDDDQVYSEQQVDDVQVSSTKVCAVECNSGSEYQPQQSQPERQVNQSQPKLVPQEPTPQEPFNANKQLVLMKKYAAARNIKDTLCTFRRIEQSGEALNSAMYNTVMHAWIKVGNVWAAEDWMEQIKEAGMADERSFIVLVKALVMVRDLQKAKALLQDMSEAGVSPSSAAFDELIGGFARGGLFNDGISLLNEMYASGVQPSGDTFQTITCLMNSARKVNQTTAGMRQVLVKYGLEPKSIVDCAMLPRLAAVVFQAEEALPAACVHAVEIKGSLVHMQAVQKTLQQHGFADDSEQCWETDTCLEVNVDGSYAKLSSPSTTKILRDVVQDEAYRERSEVVFKCVSKNGLGMPSVVESSLMQYLGNDLYYLHVQFQSETPRADIFDAISCRHPRVGFRHCWAKASAGSCGQRTLVNGEETDEACFNRHIDAVTRA